jgi:hypothetical protein
MVRNSAEWWKRNGENRREGQERERSKREEERTPRWGNVRLNTKEEEMNINDGAKGSDNVS